MTGSGWKAAAAFNALIVEFRELDAGRQETHATPRRRTKEKPELRLSLQPSDALLLADRNTKVGVGLKYRGRSGQLTRASVCWASLAYRCLDRSKPKSAAISSLFWSFLPLLTRLKAVGLLLSPLGSLTELLVLARNSPKLPARYQARDARPGMTAGGWKAAAIASRRGCPLSRLVQCLPPVQSCRSIGG